MPNEHFSWHQVDRKTSNALKDKSKRVEGEVSLAPNVLYNIQNIYNFVGLGSAFSGNYRMKKLTKRIEVDSGMTVSADVVKL